MQKKVMIFLVLLVSSSLFAEQQISVYTSQRIDDFLTEHLLLTATNDAQSALATLDALKARYETELPQAAIDLEQERLILDSIYLMESYHYLLNDENRTELRNQMRQQMLANERYLNAHQNDANKWLYLFTGDVTSFYMTRSVGATIRYGMHVKKLYEAALFQDATMTNANINLGNWFFYAPAFFGGGVDKAGKHYEAALAGARIPAEKQKAYLYLSQYWFEKKDFGRSQEYLQNADGILTESSEVTLVRRLNAINVSLFQYNRNQSGIDEKMKASEMTEDDR